MISGLGALLAFGPRHGAAPLSGTEATLKALFPIAAFLALAPVLWLFFRRTWRELDLAAHEHQKKTLAAGKYDYRPAVLFVTTALVLTLQEYYGGRNFYEENLKPLLRAAEVSALVEAAMAVLSLALFAVSAFYVMRYGRTLHETGSMSETLRVIVYPWVYVVGLGCAGLTLALLVDFLRSVTALMAALRH